MQRLLLSVSILLTLSACSRTGTVEQKPFVVTTTSILADVVQQVAPELEVRALIPAGMCPHAYEPGPRDLGAISGARMIITTGSELSPRLLTQLQAACPDADLLKLADGAFHEHKDCSSCDHDPHVWLNPGVVRTWLPRIQNGLASMTTRLRADEYDIELAEMDADVRRILRSVPSERRGLVSGSRLYDSFL